MLKSLWESRSLLIFSFCLGGMAVAAGCGQANLSVDLNQVSGVVTLDGNPLPGATVQFLPEEGRSSVGKTDADGRFELLFTDGQRGAESGSHRVMITASRELPGQQDSEGEPLFEQILPARYNSASTLTAEVPTTEELRFELQSK